MAERVLMPKQGNTVESCVILEWKKRKGDSVAVGDILCEVETDKATFEVTAEQEGILLDILHDEGDDVPVLEAIAYIGKTGEMIPRQEAAASSVKVEPSAEEAVTGAPPEPVRKSDGEHVRISPRARKYAEKTGVAVDQLIGTGPGGRILERDVKEAFNRGASISPAALERSRTSGLGIPDTGSGIGGRILSADLLPSEEPAAEETVQFPGLSTIIKVTGFRKVIARQMHASLAETAQLTLHSSADAGGLLIYRTMLKNSNPRLGCTGITLGDLVLFAVSRVLPRNPEMNAHFLGDTIVSFEHVHLGLAVDTPRGLIVPTIPFADTLSLKELSDEAKRLVEICRAGKAGPEELKSATFTVTNLGSFGIERFTPIINPPQVGILGVCAVRQEPAVMKGEIALASRIGLSLTIDHQAVDGAPGARFLQDLASSLAEIQILAAR